MTEGTPKPPPLPQAGSSRPPQQSGPTPPTGRTAGPPNPGVSFDASSAVFGTRPTGPNRPPIRPVGFQARLLSTNLLYAATAVQILVAGLTALYFYDLRRFDWTTQVTAGDAVFDLAGDFVESAFPVDHLPIDDDQRFVEFLAKRIQLERLIGWMFYGNLLVGFAELGCFIFWQLQVRRNALALGSVELRNSPVSVVVWWFVPMAVLVIPFLVAQELWRVSDPSVPPGDGRVWRTKRPSFLIGAWWSVLVLTKLLYWFTAFMLILNLITIFSPVTLQAIALTGTVIAGFLQIEYIRRQVRRQASLFQRRMRAVEKASAAGEPTIPAAEAPNQPESVSAAIV